MTEDPQEKTKPVVPEGDFESKPSSPWTLLDNERLLKLVAQAKTKNTLRESLLPKQDKLGWLNGRVMVLETDGYKVEVRDLSQTPASHQEMARPQKDEVGDVSLQSGNVLHLVSLNSEGKEVLAASLNVSNSENTNLESGNITLIRREAPGIGSINRMWTINPEDMIFVVVGPKDLDIVAGGTVEGYKNAVSEMQVKIQQAPKVQ